MTAIRLRFSPAPTGFLHIGNVRTALFNWLQARHIGGTFILRIEDTDVVRSTQESIEQIQQVLRWVGLDWDEGPYLQSARFDEYLAAAQRLLDERRRVRVLLHRGRGARAQRAGDARGPGARLRRPVPRSHRRAARRGVADEGKPRSVRFRTPDDGPQHVYRRRARGSRRSSGRRSPIS